MFFGGLNLTFALHQLVLFALDTRIQLFTGLSHPSSNKVSDNLMGIAYHISAIVRVEVLRNVFLVVSSSIDLTLAPVGVGVFLACLFGNALSMDDAAVINTSSGRVAFTFC